MFAALSWSSSFWLLLLRAEEVRVMRLAAKSSSAPAAACRAAGCSGWSIGDSRPPAAMLPYAKASRPSSSRCSCCSCRVSREVSRHDACTPAAEEEGECGARCVCAPAAVVAGLATSVRLLPPPPAALPPTPLPAFQGSVRVAGIGFGDRRWGFGVG